MSARYWSALVQYPGRSPFLVSAPEFHVVADGNEQALAALQEVIDSAWGRISPHPAPAIVEARLGRLVLRDEAP